MIMKGRDIVIALLILLLLGGLIYWRQRGNGTEELKVPEVQSSVEDSLEDKFKLEVPDDAEKTELKDVSGGNASGLFSTKYENNKLTGSVLADLPTPAAGEYYEVWVEKGDRGSDGYTAISIGRLVSAKGGYMLNLNSTSDYTANDKVLITLEKTSDKTPEKTILEGSF